MMDGSTLALSCAEELRSRALEGGGFAMFPGGEYRPDATAWAVLSLAATRSGARDHDVIESARSRLAGSQLKDGRVSISPSDPDSFWPTSLVILAWHNSEKHAVARSHAIGFLLNTSGKHWAKEEDSPLAHDTSIPGWSWTKDTHSWVEPTSMSILALSVSGFGEHDRVREGICLLMDRQLPAGGWNIGSTLVYGKESYPQSDCTGIALSALAGNIPQGEVEKSLRYLRSQVRRLRTPQSLGWGILGLGAWGQRPGQATAWIHESMSRQKKYGVYDTTLVSLLLFALERKKGFRTLFG